MNWKRIFGWIAVGLGSLILFIIVAGYVVVHTAWFHNYVLAKVEQEASTTLGSSVKVQNFDFRLSTLTADLYGVTVQGAGNLSPKPLLYVEKLTVGLKIISLIHKEFNLSELLIVHPVINLLVNSKGISNLPHPSSSSNSSSTNVFQFAIWHTGLSRGEIYFNDKESKLDANIYDLRADVNFNRPQTRYAGSLSYANAQIQYDNYSPLPHSLNVQFSATPAGASVNSAVLTLASSRITLSAEASDYSNLRLNGTYKVLLHPQDFASMLSGANIAGEVSSAGTFHYQNTPDQPALQSVILNGHLSSNQLDVVSAQARLLLRNLDGGFKLADGNLGLNSVTVDLLGGRLVASADVQHLGRGPATHVRAALQRISLNDAQRALRNPGVRQVPVTGTLAGTAAASWAGSISNMQAHADFAVHGAAGRTRATQGPVPINAVFKASYDGIHNLLTLQQATVDLPATTLRAQGEISEHSNLRVQVNSSDLHQLSLIATQLQSLSGTAGHKTSAMTGGISGSAKLTALVQGSMKRPTVTAQVTAQNLNVQGSQWRSLALNVKASRSQVAVNNGSLISTSQGSINFSGRVGLKDWSYSSASPLVATLSAKRLSIAQILELANQHYPVSGNLSAEVALSGSQLNPSGHGAIQIAKASIYDQSVQNLAVQFHGNGESVITALSVTTPAGSADAKLTFAPKTQAYDVNLNVPALLLQDLQLVRARDLGVRGTLTMTASGRGTLDNPQLVASIELPQLEVQKKSLSSVNATLNIAQHRAQAILNTNVMQASIRAHATVDLTDGYYGDVVIDTGNVPLQPLLAVYAPSLPSGFQGNTEVHASFKGPLKDPAKIVAQVTIPVFSASYQSLQIATAEPLHIDYNHSILTIQPVEFRGTDTTLRLQGTIPLENASSMSLSAQGSVDLRLAQIFSPDIKSAGRLVLHVNSTGNIRNPNVNGQVRLEDASFSQPGVPLGLEDGNGVFDIDSSKVVITSLKGEVGGGTLSASGSVAYRPAVQANLALEAKGVNLLYPTGVRTVLDSNLVFAGTEKASALTGRVLLDSLSFTPAFDLSSFATQFGGVSVPSATPSVTDNVKLAINVQSAQNLSAYSSTISLQGAVNLQVIGTAANPVIVGRTELTSGDLFFMNNRYVLQRGIISFINPTQTEPILNVQVSTTIEQYNLTLNLNGPLDKLNTSYTSQPPLATADIISLLYRGETTAEASAAGTSADSMIAGQVAGQFTSGISKLAGISSLQIDPLIGGSNSNPSARVALQQRVTKNLLFTFSTDVEQPQGEIVEGDYQINKRWSIGVIRDEVGGISVDARVHTSH